MKRVWNVTRQHHGCFSCMSSDLPRIYCFFAFMPFSESVQDSVELGSGAWESCDGCSRGDLSGRAGPGELPSTIGQGNPKS